MNKAGGFVVIHKKILDWEWYKCPATLSLFIHLILAANFEDARFEGRLIKRGQLVTSLQSLSEEAGLSVRQVRTALNHLISTGEVTNKSYTKYRVITIVNYNKYQDKRQTKRQTIDKQETNNRQSNDNQTTNNRQQYNKNNKNNKENNKRERGFTPPALDDVRDYVRGKGYRMDADAFFDHFSASGWVMKGGQKIKDWKAAVRNWERRENSGDFAGNSRGMQRPRVDYTDLPD